jgi:threonine dehydrogenase-like Zn-dependent dehydrogenase
MKAMVLHEGRFALETLAEPRPDSGQLLVAPLACGVCGSDLHAKDHAPHLCDLLHRAGFRGFMDPAKPVVMGHEFCCEVLESGAKFYRGQRVVALPFMAGPDGVVLLGYSNHYNGAFAEQMVLDEAAAFDVPDHVPTEIAALAEPLAVAVHAVGESGASSDCAFAVFGAGPVGLFVIARLRALGLGPVLVIEPTPSRRAMAETMGADVVMSVGDAAADDWWAAQGLHLGLSDSMAQAPELKTRERAILFDCVGKPGMLMAIGKAAPVGASIVTIGTCMETDPIEPAFLLQKGLTVKFVFAYSPQEFADAFEMIKADPNRLKPMVSGIVGLSGVDEAFKALTSGGSAIKLLVSPGIA